MRERGQSDLIGVHRIARFDPAGGRSSSPNGDVASRDDELRVTISSLDLFAGCSRHEQELIGRLATLARLEAGVVLCDEGEIGQTFYAIARGEVAVTGDGLELARLGPGCGFGEIALLRRSGRRIATVVTTMRSELVLFSRPEFATLMAEVPLLAHALIAESRRRMAVVAGPHGPFATS